jgi:ABC-2 type transport system ATP-binding protein
VSEAGAAAVVLEARGLERRFGAVQALGGVSLSVQAGELYGLVGPDGAGKTTTLRILAGVMGPQGGEVRVLGRDPLRNDPELREAMGYMPQQYSLYGDLSVEENLRFFADMFCLDRKAYGERRSRLLQITRLEPFTGRRADALSGGMYKKLALACALLPRPRLLLLDEPTNGVDPVSRRELWALLFELCAEQMAVVVSTPYMDEAARCHRVGLMHGGRIVLDGAPQALLGRFSERVLQATPGAAVLRTELERKLQGHPALIASSAAGEGLRLVARAAQLDALLATLEELGAHAEPVAPDFEDLFLTVTA